MLWRCVQSFDAPQGRITLYPNHHVSKGFRVGRVLPSGQFEIVLQARCARVRVAAWSSACFTALDNCFHD